MIDRIEIPARVKLEVFKRAGGPESVVCEGCGLRLGGKRFDYDHQVPECFQTLPKHERPPITADDVKLLGYECCHKQKSASEHRANCHGKRIYAKAANARPKKRSSFRANRNSALKVKLDGTVVNRETGEPVR